MYHEKVWDLLFFVLYDALKFHFFHKLLYRFSKNGTNGKTGCASVCLNISLVSFHFTSRSTAFESFSRGSFDLVLNFFHFLKY